ncbi:MAG: hypothetical protein JWP13_955 [Candidatus Saccharibacteria bacterium]|nr:hypothetical protein [Candidatus Saccharibacteria bacterium]
MIKILKFVASKLSFVMAVAAAAVVGGLSTGAVMAMVPGVTPIFQGITAIIPNPNGDVQTCYNKTSGAIRVISNEDTCSAYETALNLGSNAVKATSAFFSVKDGVVDTASMRNIDSYQWYPGEEQYGGVVGYCLKTSFETAFSIATLTGLPHIASVRSESASDAAEVQNYCGSDSNAFISSGQESDDLTAWFSR